MHHNVPDPAWVLVNMFANIGIVVGYVLVPFTVLRYLPLTRNVLFSGSLFFLTCALTHLSMAVPIDFKWMVVNHVVQAVSVVWFVLAFFGLLRKANALRARHAAKLHPVPQPTAIPPAGTDGVS